MNINSPFVEISKFLNIFDDFDGGSTSDERMANAALRIASYACMIFSALAGVALTGVVLAAGGSALVAAIPLATGLGVSIAFHEVYQVTRNYEEKFLDITLGAKARHFFTKFGFFSKFEFAPDWTNQKTLRALTEHTLILRHLVF